MQDSLKTLTGDVTEPEVFTLLGTVEGIDRLRRKREYG